eukprot:scaffold96440_cov69-Phaeocystis_antarctica.AAC.1
MCIRDSTTPHHTPPHPHPHPHPRPHPCSAPSLPRRWAVGVFVFELLTGHPPFEGDKPSDIFDQISDYASAGDKANQRLADLLVQNKVSSAEYVVRRAEYAVSSAEYAVSK